MDYFYIIYCKAFMYSSYGQKYMDSCIIWAFLNRQEANEKKNHENLFIQKKLVS